MPVGATRSPDLRNELLPGRVTAGRPGRHPMLIPAFACRRACPQPATIQFAPLRRIPEWKGAGKQDRDEELCPGRPRRQRVVGLVDGFDDEEVLVEVAVPVGAGGSDSGRFGGGVDIEGRTPPGGLQLGGSVWGENFGGGHHALGCDVQPSGALFCGEWFQC